MFSEELISFYNTAFIPAVQGFEIIFRQVYKNWNDWNINNG